MRVFPTDSSAFGGKIQAGACFVVDGKSSKYPGWYHYQKGQEAYGVEVSVNQDTYQLWVKGYYLESFGNDLTALPEIEVTETK